MNELLWEKLRTGKTKALFETPSVHGLIRAFHRGRNAFGMCIIVRRWATVRHADLLSVPNFLDTVIRVQLFGVMLRIASLLGDKAEGEAFKEIFKARSEYLHGRSMKPLSHTQRLHARLLARRVTRRLTEVCLNAPASTTRRSYLESLVGDGLKFWKPGSYTRSTSPPLLTDTPTPTCNATTVAHPGLPAPFRGDNRARDHRFEDGQTAGLQTIGRWIRSSHSGLHLAVDAFAGAGGVGGGAAEQQKCQCDKNRGHADLGTNPARCADRAKLVGRLSGIKGVGLGWTSRLVRRSSGSEGEA